MLRDTLLSKPCPQDGRNLRLHLIPPLDHRLKAPKSSLIKILLRRPYRWASYLRIRSKLEIKIWQNVGKKLKVPHASTQLINLQIGSIALSLQKVWKKAVSLSLKITCDSHLDRLGSQLIILGGLTWQQKSPYFHATGQWMEIVTRRGFLKSVMRKCSHLTKL